MYYRVLMVTREISCQVYRSRSIDRRVYLNNSRVLANVLGNAMLRV